MTKFYRKLDKAARRILEAVSLALSLTEAEKGYFLGLHSGHNNQLRLLHYPSIPTEQLRKQIVARMPAHCDWRYVYEYQTLTRYPCFLGTTDTQSSTFTILFQDDCGGLEFENPKHPGSFVPATPITDALTLNVGDMLQRFSNGVLASMFLNWANTKMILDVFPSASHRVTLPPETASANGRHATVTRQRFSIPYFVAPDADKVVSCLPSCVSDEHPAKFEPVSFAEYGANISRYQYVAS